MEPSASKKSPACCKCASPPALWADSTSLTISMRKQRRRPPPIAQRGRCGSAGWTSTATATYRDANGSAARRTSAVLTPMATASSAWKKRLRRTSGCGRVRSRQKTTPSRRRSVPMFWGLAISRTGGLPVPVWIAVIFSLERAPIVPALLFLGRKVSITHFALTQLLWRGFGIATLASVTANPSPSHDLRTAMHTPRTAPRRAPGTASISPTKKPIIAPPHALR